MNILLSSLEDKFNERQKIYQDKDLYHEIYNKNIVLLEDDIENKINTISSNVAEGRDLLVTELKKYNDYIESERNLSEFSQTALESCHKSINLFNAILQDSKENKNNKEFEMPIEELSNNVDEVIYGINNIMNIINTHIDKRKEILKKDMDKNIAILRKLIDVYGIIKSTTLVHICPICLTNEVSVFSIPCGHSLCSECISRTKHCCWCRTRIERIGKIFFS